MSEEISSFPPTAAVPSMATVLQVSSSDWLKVYGLSSQGLTLDQLLPRLGFKQTEGSVNGRRVKSQYGDGLFTRHPDSTGRVFNICNIEEFEPVRSQLEEAVSQLKARYEWLTSGSRLSFGVVCERRVVMVMDSCANKRAQLKPFLKIASDVISEQFHHVEQFNLIRCCEDVESFKDELVKSGKDTIVEALEWVAQTTPQTPPLKTNVLEAVKRAQSYSGVEGIYLFCHGEESLRAYDLLLEKVTVAPPPLHHVIVYDCDSLPALKQYQQLASTLGGKCHTHNPVPAKGNPLLSSCSSLSSHGTPPLSAHHSQTSSVVVSSLPVHLQDNENVSLLWSELSKARDTLAEVQALHLELSSAPVADSSCHSNNEECMTSKQWLQTNGLKSNKLMFADFVSSLAFLHCNGRVKMLQPTRHRESDIIEMIPQKKLVHAQYCKDFVHIRLKKEGVVHLQLSDHTHKKYCDKVTSVMGACQSRLDWLKSGSREMFGTLVENKVAMVIDTSASMAERLDLVKDKIQQLLKDQLLEKEEFTLLHFSSAVGMWREQLVATSEENLQTASEWIEELRAEGSSNTMLALIKALSVPGVEGVYLLSDGRPDQDVEEVLKELEQLPVIPVHTISFNCADSQANQFLAQLASTTGGRYRYLSEDVSDPEGPKTYQGEDIKSLEDEIQLALEQMRNADELLSECEAVRKKHTTNKKKSRTRSYHSTATNRHVPVTSSPLSTPSKKAKVLMSSRKWLEKNSLSALNLTLMDALGPTAIPHSAKHVPLLDKHVTSKVFDSIFPLAHVTKGQKVTLINPLGANLPDYEEKLERQVNIYWNRLTRLAWSVIPSDKREALRERCGVLDDSEVLYQQHRDILRDMLEELGWPRPQKDFDLLEKEIKQAEEFKRYSESLREEASQARSTLTSQSRMDRLPSGTSLHSIGDTSTGLYSTTSAESLVELMDQLQLHTITPSPPPRSIKATGKNVVSSRLVSLKGQKVIARSKDDGFYYPGVVTSVTDNRHVAVQLADATTSTTLVKHVLPVGGAGPCPVLQVGDYVLVRVRTCKGPHPAYDGSCDYYIPGIVQVLPADSRKSHALHSVMVFNGRIVTCSRRGMVKISTSVYNTACKYIRARIDSTGMKSNKQSHSHSENEFRSHSISEYESSRSQSRASVHIPSVSSHYNSDDEHGVASNDIPSLLQQQRNQGELLEQYRHDIDSLKHRQSEIEERLTRNDNDNQTIPPGEDTSSPAVCNQGVNTGPMMEDKGIETDPLKESCGVGTTDRSDSEEEQEMTDGQEEEQEMMDGQEEKGAVVGQEEPNSPEHSSQHSSGSSPAHDHVDTPQLTPLHEQLETPHFTPLHHHTPLTTPTHQQTPTQHTTPTHDVLNPAELSFPDEDDPLVNQVVLARWPDDGWYYRGIIVRPAGHFHYLVQDSTHDLENIHMADIITDLQDALKPFQLGDTVAGLHPGYPYSYAPGKIVGVAESGYHFTVELYDGVQSLLPRQEVYHLARAKHCSDVEYIEMREKAWIGQAVIARNDTDGLYYPGKVLKQAEGKRRQYLVKWANGNTQEQEVIHMYGRLTKQRPLRTGDKVLALAQPSSGVFMPGEIHGVQSGQLLVEFCDGKQEPVEPTHCFWVTEEYFQSTVKYICSNIELTPSPSLSTLSETTEEQSEYSASYLH